MLWYITVMAIGKGPSGSFVVAVVMPKQEEHVCVQCGVAFSTGCWDPETKQRF